MSVLESSVRALGDADITGQARGLLALTRPANAVLAGVLTFVGAFVAAGTTLPAIPTAAAIVATVLALGAGNAINDYFDREIDRINAPDRPIPSGAVSPTQARAFSVFLFLLAVVLVLATLPLLAILIAVVNLAALVSYTPWFKGRPGAGNALAAYLGGSTFLFGGAAVGSIETPAVLFLLAALATFTREVIKDVEDVAGDAAEDLRTLPIEIGERRSLALAAALLVVAVVVSPVPYLTGTFGLAYLVVVVPADLVMLYAAYEAFEDPTAGQTHLKYGMALAAAAFIVGRLAVIGLP